MHARKSTAFSSVMTFSSSTNSALPRIGAVCKVTTFCSPCRKPCSVSVIWSRLSTITSIVGNPAESSNNHRMSNAGNNDETHSPLHKLFTSRPLFHCTARLWCSHSHCARQTGPTHFLSNQRQGGTLINFFGRQGWRS